MTRTVKIQVGRLSATAILNDTKTADAIWQALPLKAKATTWGDEIYFAIPVKCGPENPQEVVEVGDLGYWMPGSAFCIFFGQTPVSARGEIRPASPVNVFGRIEGEAQVFKGVRDGAQVVVERLEEPAGKQ